MVGWILKKILGSKNQREIKRMAPLVQRINELDEQFKALSDDDLRAKTAAWKTELAAIPDLLEQWTKLDEIFFRSFFQILERCAFRQLRSWHGTPPSVVCPVSAYSGWKSGFSDCRQTWVS